MLPLSLALAWIASVLTQRVNAPTLGSEFVAIVMAVPLILGGLMRQRINRPRLALLAMSSIPVLLMLITSLRAAQPGQALIGVAPNWQGWVLWASALGWFWVAVAAADGRDLSRVVQVLVWAGSITAVWAILEALGVLSPYHDRTGLNAMAFFDSSQSMGQVLVLTLAATASSALRRGSPLRIRQVYWALAAVQLTALLVSGARAAVVGAFITVAAFGLLDERRTGIHRAIRYTSAAVCTAFVIGFGVISAAWTGALGPQAYVKADQLLSGRFAVWNHVTERMGDHLLLGIGPEPFDAIITWDALSNGHVAASLTYDQHSILLTWLMSTGLLGLITFGAAAVFLCVHIVRAATARHSTPAARALAAGTAGVFVSMLSSWPEPIALLSVSVIAGCLASNGSLNSPENETLPSRSPIVLVPALGASLAAIITLVAFLPSFEARLTTARADDYPQLVGRIENALAHTHDYSYLTNELVLIQRQGSLAVPDDKAVELIQNLAASYPIEAEGRAEIPLLALEILADRSQYLSPEEFWELNRFYAKKGKALEPRNGVWDYSLARAAYLAHLEEAPKYVDTALNHDQPDSAEMYLRHLR